MRTGEAGRQWNGPGRTRFLDSSWGCSRGKSLRSVRISLSTALRSPGAASAGPGSASPVRTAASPSGFSFPQEASTHKTPNKILNAGQLVPKISGCRRRGLTATCTLCFCPRNWIANSTTGYFTTSPCTHPHPNHAALIQCLGLN